MKTREVGDTVTAGLTKDELTDVYERYGGFILRRAFRFFRDRVVADDILMEVLLRLLQRGRGFVDLEGPGQRIRWLEVTTYRACLDFRRARRELPTEVEGSWAAEPSVPAIEQRDLLRRLQEVLRPEDRALAVLYFEEQRPKVEIHRMVGRSRPFVDQRLAYISDKLQGLAAPS